MSSAPAYCLLQELSLKERTDIHQFSLEKCEILAELAHLAIDFTDHTEPGRQLLKALSRAGRSRSELRQLLLASQNKFTTNVKPQCKIAILIANKDHDYYTKLSSTISDCEKLAGKLKELGFIVIMVTNTASHELRTVLDSIYSAIPEGSYVFIYYAGHGCQLCNTCCIIGVDCPSEQMKLEHCVTDNYILQGLSNAKAELGILIMDMCRNNLDRELNPQIYQDISSVQGYSIHKNLLIAYSTQAFESAFEVVYLNTSRIIDTQDTYRLKTGDTCKIESGSSQYFDALYTRIGERVEVSKMIDKVHSDIENSTMSKQRPIKVQCGVSKLSLHDRILGDKNEIANNLENKLSNFKSKFGSVYIV